MKYRNIGIFVLVLLISLSACGNKGKGILARLDQPYAENPEAQNKIKKMFGAEILIPADMTSIKKADKFLWLSNNASSGMKNIVIYELPYNIDMPVSTTTFCQLRDSVMKDNIKGENDSMYVVTVSESVSGKWYPQTATCKYNGLWEMKNDAMGGPFLCNVICDKARHRLLFVEGFIYAPEINDKTNLLNQLKTVLGSLNIKNNGK